MIYFRYGLLRTQGGQPPSPVHMTTGNPENLVAVGDPLQQAEPHVRREGTKRHGTDDKRENLPGWRNPSAVNGAFEKIFGREYPAKGCGGGKFMSAGIKRRIGEHGNPVKHDPVKKGWSGGISAATTLHRFTFLVVEEDGAVFVGAGNGSYRFIGTDHGAHAAADTEFGWIGFLTDTGKGPVVVAPVFVEDIEFGNSLPHMGQADGPFRADRSAMAAEGTSVFPVLDNPGQICWG